MKKILIPTDFSENASDAFFYAAKVFGGEKVEFIVVYSLKMKLQTLPVGLILANLNMF